MIPGLNKINTWGILMATALCLLPLALLCLFVHPVGTHDWDWISYFNRKDLSFFEYQKHVYEDYTGRFFSTAILSSTHYWYNLFLFKLIPILLITGVGLGFQSFIKKLFRYCPFSSFEIVIFTLGFLLLFYSGLTGVFEGLYIISSTFTYVVGLIMFLFWAGILIMLDKQGREGALHLSGVKSYGLFILLFLLTTAINGCNEIHMVGLYLCLGFYFLFNLINKRKVPHWLWLLGVLSLPSLYVSFFAAANFERMGGYEGSGDILKAIVLTIGATGFNFSAWLSNAALFFAALLFLPYGKRMASALPDYLFTRKSGWFFAIAGLALQVIPLLLLFFAAGSNTLPERVVDMLYAFFLLSFFGMLVWACGAFPKAMEKIQLPNYLAIFLWVGLLFSLVFGSLKLDRSKEAPSSLSPAALLEYLDVGSNYGRAWIAVLNGSAKEYDRAMLQSYEDLKSCRTHICRVKPPTRFPDLIYDPLFDRRNDIGEYFITPYLGDSVRYVFYEGVEIPGR